MVCEAELRKTGGRLTPEALEAIKARPEFRGLSPEEVARGMQSLERRERLNEKKAPEKLPQSGAGKKEGNR